MKADKVTEAHTQFSETKDPSSLQDKMKQALITKVQQQIADKQAEIKKLHEEIEELGCQWAHQSFRPS